MKKEVKVFMGFLILACFPIILRPTQTGKLELFITQGKMSTFEVLRREHGNILMKWEVKGPLPIVIRMGLASHNILRMQTGMVAPCHPSRENSYAFCLS